MKVLYLPPPARRAGQLARYSFLEEEICALADAGIVAYVVTTGPAGDHPSGVRIRRLPAGDSLEERRRTAAFLVRRQRLLPARSFLSPREVYHAARIERFAADVISHEAIDVIHSYFGWPKGFGGLLASAATGRPLIAGIRGADVTLDASVPYGARRNPLHDRAIRRLLATADRTVFVSNFLRTEGLRLGARFDRARVIKKGVHLDRFQVIENRLEVRRQLGLLDRRPLILTVAGLIRLKGVHYGLEAVARLRDSHDFSYVVCGDGPERQRLEALSLQLGLSDRTTFVGRIDRQRMPQYFAASDMLLHTSLHEASGNVLLEAMASGRPVVCTDSGGPAEYVSHDETGFVVPVADTVAMANRIAQVLERPRLADELGRQGRLRAERDFGYDRMIGQTLDIYDEAVADRRTERVAVSGESHASARTF